MDLTAVKRAPPPAMTASLSLIRLPDVCRATGLCRSMIYQLEAAQRFPRRVRIGERAVGWVASEVQLWITGRIDAHRL